MDEEMLDFGSFRSLLHEPPTPARYRALLQHVEEAWDETPGEVEEVWVPYALDHLQRWFEAIPIEDVPKRDYRGGLLWHDPLELADEDALRVCAPWHPCAPLVRSLALGNDAEDLLADLPPMPSLRALRLEWDLLTDETAALFGAWEGLDRVTRLECAMYGAGQRQLEPLLQREGLREHLRVLALHGDGWITSVPRGVWPPLPALESVSLQNVACRGEEMRALLASASPDRLRALVVFGEGEEMDLHNALEALAWSDRLGGLRALGLEQCVIDDATLRALLDNPTLRGLEALSFQCSHVNGALLWGSDGPELPALRSLDLRDCHAVERLDVLAAWMRRRPLEHLALSGGTIQNASRLEAFLTALAPGTLRDLTITHYILTDDDLDVLLSWPGLAALDVLDLAFSEIKPSQVRRLLTSGMLRPGALLRLDRHEHVPGRGFIRRIVEERVPERAAATPEPQHD